MNSYDEYMRNVLGYSNMCTPMSPYHNINSCSDDLESMFPEVYRVVYPMVCHACDNVTMPVTESMVNTMTDDIYDRVAADGRINIEVSIETDFRNTQSDSDEIRDSRQRRPRRRNRFLRDLIRILLLRELLRRHPRFPMRPF